MLGVLVSMVPEVIGAVGAVNPKLGEWLKKILHIHILQYNLASYLHNVR